MIIEPATLADLDEIQDIERHSFTRPWPRESHAAELTREFAHLDVARERTIVGFCNYWLVAGELHILSIAVHPDHRRRGIAGALLDHALAASEAVGATLATLEVRRSNRPAIALYERAGFKIVHVRERYYQDDNEDALVMLRALTAAPP